MMTSISEPESAACAAIHRGEMDFLGATLFALSGPPNDELTIRVNVVTQRPKIISYRSLPLKPGDTGIINLCVLNSS